MSPETARITPVVSFATDGNPIYQYVFFFSKQKKKKKKKERKKVERKEEKQIGSVLSLHLYVVSFQPLFLIYDSSVFHEAFKRGFKRGFEQANTVGLACGKNRQKKSASPKTALSGAHVYDRRDDESAISERDTYP